MLLDCGARPDGSGNSLAGDLESVLERTRENWQDLRGDRVFITGGTGFMGSWLLETFAWANRRLALGATAVVLTRDPKVFARKAPHLAGDRSIILTCGDVRRFEYPEGPFGFVVHAATSPSIRMISEQPEETLKTIVDGTRRVLDMTRRCGAQRLLFTSSGAVYGRQPAGVDRLNEEFSGPLEPADAAFAYAHGKRLAEQLCIKAATTHGCAAVIARCFTFAGPYLPLDDRYAVGNFVSARIRREAIRISGDGTATRSFLYAADLAAWLWTLLFRGQSARVYNVGSEEEVSIKQLAEIVAAAGPFGPGRVVVDGLASGAPPERYVPSTRRVNDELGLVPTVSLSDGISRMVRWNLTRL